jgi:site-specific DNA-methyltransferase (adenine-specific)
MHPDLAAIAAQGWNVEETTDRRGLTYYEARRGGYERGAYTPAMLRELCEAAPMIRPYYDHGGITIYHGDCREVLPMLPAVGLVLTDPPYGVNLETNYRERKRTALALCNDFAPVAGDDEPFDPAPLLALDVPTILWGANYYADKLPPSPSWIVWDKVDGLMSGREVGFNDQADLEVAWSNLGGPARIYRHRWMGAMKKTEQQARRVHPTQKPVALMRWCLVRAGLKRGDLVFDPYMGSGPVAQACHEMGLRYIGVELVKSYCDEAIKRLSQTVMVLDLEAA